MPRRDLAMGGFGADVNVSENCDNLQKNELQNARDEMQKTLIKVMSKIFSAKVVIERLPDIDIKNEKESENEEDPELEDNKENVLKDCQVAESQMCPNCMSNECSGCNRVDKNCTDTTETGNNSFSDDRPENESNIPNAKKSNRQSYLQYYHKFCPDCNETQFSGKRIPKCKNCNSRWHYECKICSKQLSTYGGIIRHLHAKCLENGHYFACFECDYTATYRLQVNVHLKKVHSIVDSLDRVKKFKREKIQNDLPEASPIICSICERPFEKIPHLLRHMQFCGQTKKKAGLKKLRNDTLDKCVHHCVKCNKTMKNHKSGNFYGKKCGICHTKFSFKCKQCNHIFHSYNSIHLHLKVQHKVHSKDAFKCPECDYKTSTIEYLSRHVRRKHVNETHACPKCDRKYKTRMACREHLRYCTNERKFECDICSNKFKAKMNLQRHIYNVHTDGNEIDCPQCGITMKNKYGLQFHLTYCQKEPQYKCKICPFKTKYKTEIKKHQIRIHFADVQKNEDEEEDFLTLNF